MFQQFLSKMVSCISVTLMLHILVANACPSFGDKSHEAIGEHNINGFYSANALNNGAQEINSVQGKPSLNIYKLTDNITESTVTRSITCTTTITDTICKYNADIPSITTSSTYFYSEMTGHVTGGIIDNCNIPLKITNNKEKSAIQKFLAGLAPDSTSTISEPCVQLSGFMSRKILSPTLSFGCENNFSSRLSLSNDVHENIYDSDINTLQPEGGVTKQLIVTIAGLYFDF